MNNNHFYTSERSVQILNIAPETAWDQEGSCLSGNYEHHVGGQPAAG